METIEKVKYPRTYHCPWSPGRSDDDKVHTQAAIDNMFIGKMVVVTEKTDGENSTIYPNGATHARSLDSKNHESRSWIRQFAAKIGRDIPEGWRVCGENLFARHSLAYDRLPSYFLCFGIYDQNNRCLSWDDTVLWAELLGLDLVPVLYRGVWDENLIRSFGTPGAQSAFGPEREGYVVRLADSFDYEDFSKSVSKFVRASHVTTGDHWMNGPVVPNRLAPR